MAVLAIFNILSVNPIATALDAVLEAFRPPDRERDRESGLRPLTITRIWLTATAMPCVKRANPRGSARTSTQEWRGLRAAAVTMFVKQNGPLPAEFADHAGHPQSTY
jgi:hypothetical protein